MFLLFAGCALENKAVVQTTGEINDAEYGVYSQAISGYKFFGETKTMVIQAQTDTGKLPLNDAMWDDISRMLPGLTRDVFGKYTGLNSKQCMLKNKFSTAYECVIRDHDELDRFFSSGVERGWESFYKQYPYAQGIITFSRAAFNRDGTLALVYMEFKSRELAGEGSLYLYKKEGKNWTLVKTVRLWLS
jgi:hypothetical protein